MSKSSYIGANVAIATDTFSGWINKTNQVRYDLGTVVVTVGNVPQPNSSNGAETSGNAHIEGIFSANTVAIGTALRGGTVSIPAPLLVNSNVIFNDSPTIQVDANTETFSIDANNMVISSNVVFDGAGKTIDISTAGTNILVGPVQVNTITTLSANVTLDGTTLTTTANANFTSSTFDINAGLTTVGANNTAFTMVVNADTTLANTTISDELIANANATFNGITTTINNNLVVGSDNTDNLTINAKLASNLIPDTISIDLGSEAEPFNDLHIDTVWSNIDIEALGEVRLKGAGSTVRQKSTTTGYQDLDITLETSVGATKTPFVAFANSTVQGIKGSANVTQDLGDVATWYKRAYVANVETNFVRIYGAPGGNGLDVQGDVNIGGSTTVVGTSILDDVTIATTLGVTGIATFSGAANFNGNVTLGDTGADSVVFNADINSNVLPNTNVTYNLGSITQQWNDIYTQDLFVSANVSITNGLAVSGISSLSSAIISNTLSVAGQTDLNGNINLGDSVTDTISVIGAIDTSILPNASVTHNLGSVALKWNDLHIDQIFGGGVAQLSDRLDLAGTTTRIIRSKSDDPIQNDIQIQLQNTDTVDVTVTPLVVNSLAVKPGVTNTFDLGATGDRWKTIYSANIVTDKVTTNGAPGTVDVIVGGDAVISGNLIVTGDTTLSSDTTLALSNSDITDLNILGTLSMSGIAGVDTNFEPLTDSIYNLGADLTRWSSVYADNLYGALAFSNLTSVPDPIVTVTLTGDVTGSGNATLTNLGNGNISFVTTIQPNSIALGTDTTGDYVATVVSGTGLSVTGTGEGAAVSISHADTSAVLALSVDNIGGSVIQDIALTFDTFGHVLTHASVSTDLDLRYSKNTFQTVTSDVGSAVADNLADTLTLTGGAGISTTASVDTITFASTDTLDSVTARGATTSNAMTVGAMTVNGDLNVLGSLNTISSTTINVDDTFLKLNAAFVGDADMIGVDAGITVERGLDADRSIRWNETTDRWEFQHSDGIYYNLPISSEYQLYSWALQTNSVSRGTIIDGEAVNFVGGIDTDVGYAVGSNTITFNHANTSSLLGDFGVTGAANGTYIKSITVDARGHLTAVTTDDFDTRFLAIGAKAVDSNLLDNLDSTQFIRSDVVTNVSADTEWQDNVKVRFGNSADMTITHTGTVNQIDLTLGDLIVRDGTTDRFTFARTTGNFTAAGNINVGGNVDGRNIAGDGTKLDGIETLADVTDATNVSAALTNGVAALTSGEVTQLSNIGTELISAAEWGFVAAATAPYTSVESAKLSGIESGADVTDATNVNAAGAVMNIDSTTTAMSFVIDEDDMISNSATKVPTQQSVKAYVDASPSGLTKIETITISNTSTVDFTGFDASKYSSYEVVFENVVCSIAARILQMITSSDGGLTYDAASYAYQRMLDGTSSSNGSSAVIQIINGLSNSAGSTGLSGSLMVYGAGNAAINTSFVGSFSADTAVGFPKSLTVAARREVNEDTDGLRFFFDSGNVFSGTITVYGRSI
ncbi:MAG: hypothetical protein COA84_13180 [Robiginitomaculum sp.]|nr:MAG: hypothetical protein COA84_13180 [Robiginitomaculum sp.]